MEEEEKGFKVGFGCSVFVDEARASLEVLHVPDFSLSKIMARNMTELSFSKEVKIEELFIIDQKDFGIALETNFNAFEISELDSLKKLVLFDCSLRSLSFLSKSFLSTLRVLSFGSNQLDDEALQKINFFASAKSLEHLDLSCNLLVLEKTLVRFPKSLKSLNLAGNRIKCLNLFPLKQNLLEKNSDNFPKLKQLNLSGNALKFFRELLIIRFIASRNLDALWLDDPIYGPNPVCLLVNYSIFMSKHYGALKIIDGRKLRPETKQSRNRTFLKKKLYYQMKVRNLRKNSVTTREKARKRIELQTKKLRVLLAESEKILGLMKIENRSAEGSCHIREELCGRLNTLENILHDHSSFLVEFDLRTQSILQNCQNILEKEFASCGNFKVVPESKNCEWRKDIEDFIRARTASEEKCHIQEIYKIVNGQLKKSFNMKVQAQRLNKINFSKIKKHKRSFSNAEFPVLLTCPATKKSQEKMEFLFLNEITCSTAKETFCSEDLLNQLLFAGITKSMTHSFKLQNFIDEKNIADDCGQKDQLVIVFKAFLDSFKVIANESELDLKDYSGNILHEQKPLSQLLNLQRKSYFLADDCVCVPEYLARLRWDQPSNAISKEKENKKFSLSGKCVSALKNPLRLLLEQSEQRLNAMKENFQQDLEHSSQMLESVRCRRSTITSTICTDTSFFSLGVEVPDLPKNYFLLSSISLRHSHLRCLKPFLSQVLPNLKTLDLDFNQINDVSSLSELYSLGSLSVRWNKLSSLTSFIKISKKLPNLNCLDLRNNPLVLQIEWKKRKDQLLHLFPTLSYLNSEKREEMKVPESKGVPSLSNLKNCGMTTNTFNLVLQENNFELPKIRILDVRGNFLEKLDERFSSSGNFLMLQSLNLSKNLITEISRDCFKSLTVLKELHIRNNFLRSLRFAASMSSLEVLDVSENQISSIADLEMCFSLLELYLEENLVTDPKEIFSLTLLSNLVSLDLRNNSIINWKCFRGFLIFHVVSLKVLNNKIIQKQEVDSAFEKYSGKLTRIYLDSKVGKNLNLKSLDISGCKINRIEPFAVDGHHLPSLRKLNVSRNSLQTLIGLCRLGSLEELDVSNNKLTSLYVEKRDSELAELNPLTEKQEKLYKQAGIKGMKNLKKLSLGVNHFHDYNSIGLEFVPKLEFLDVSKNRISPRCSSLTCCGSLRELKLSDTGLDSLTLGSIFTEQFFPFAASPNLQKLDLSRNNLKFLPNLLNLVNLEKLDISFNNLENIEQFSLLSNWDNVKFTEMSCVGNPVSKLKLYRSAVLFSLTTLNVLDGHEVCVKEKEESTKAFSMTQIKNDEPAYLKETNQALNFSKSKLDRLKRDQSRAMSFYTHAKIIARPRTPIIYPNSKQGSRPKMNRNSSKVELTKLHRTLRKFHEKDFQLEIHGNKN
eukprot:snap_masked-scaffold_23-processed-gene-4.20-mRNA-1 protein AED:1.00 eAED:1.00 QI:0/-1/0/0/-1/1/1/0/1401